VCEAALAHVIQNKAEAAYRRGDLFDKRRQRPGACIAPEKTPRNCPAAPMRRETAPGNGMMPQPGDRSTYRSVPAWRPVRQLPNLCASGAQRSKVVFQVRKQLLRAIYISSHPGKTSRKNELVTAKTFNLYNLMEGVARLEFLLHDHLPLLSKRSGQLGAAPIVLEEKLGSQFSTGATP
jgi:hypothetical protein